MGTRHFLIAAVTMFSVSLFAAQEPDIEKELANLADKLATQVKESGRKKMAVLDFTDLQGNSSELGRYLAEQLSVSLVERRSGFSIMDRANLRTILAEHKLTVDGLVEPENVKKLGQFSGVDAIVLGNITLLEGQIAITIKIIATDTAEIVAATSGKIPKSKDIEQLLGREIRDPTRSSQTSPDTRKPVVVQFGSNNESPSKSTEPREEEILAGLEPQAARLAKLLLANVRAKGIDVRITLGRRELNQSGTGLSVHSTGRAFDVAVFKNGVFSANSVDYRIIGQIGKNLGLDWGGSMKNGERMHFEIPGTTASFQRGNRQ